jgi:hypothetical protein
MSKVIEEKPHENAQDSSDPSPQGDDRKQQEQIQDLKFRGKKIVTASEV